MVTPGGGSFLVGGRDSSIRQSGPFGVPLFGPPFQGAQGLVERSPNGGFWGVCCRGRGGGGWGGLNLGDSPFTIFPKALFPGWALGGRRRRGGGLFFAYLIFPGAFGGGSIEGKEIFLFFVVSGLPLMPSSVKWTMFNRKRPLPCGELLQHCL